MSEAASNSTGASEATPEAAMAAVSISEKKEEVAQPEPTSNGHPLETGWTIWYDKTPHTAKPNSTSTYTDHLKNLGSFRTIEEFWDLYTRLVRPCDLTPTSHYHVFREGYMPMWETFPNGGCWVVRFKKVQAKANVCLGKCWEELLFGAIGEAFAEPDVVGVVLSVKPKEDVIQVWNRDNQDNNVRFEIGEKLKMVMTLDQSNVIEYKEHALSMKDPKGGGGTHKKPWLAAIRTSGGGPAHGGPGRAPSADDSEDKPLEEQKPEEEKKQEKKEKKEKKEEKKEEAPAEAPAAEAAAAE
eukprot:CAMPEP_0181323058 /NCGR_PEP_ID=MMETSP1101-20121128/19572_1 /TAXON_ID=46948 /ORGANISM="Rhodomonas abbreviata, Strain Caron Lab Isolate" /LENGTH=297 /DNA_ID=CAMNT_0023431039 /DNA_START=93 /DNA_END=986 /DNA_ORIENTATION=+